MIGCSHTGYGTYRQSGADRTAYNCEELCLITLDTLMLSIETFSSSRSTSLTDQVSSVPLLETIKKSKKTIDPSRTRTSASKSS
jgi:hypothetical protein